MVTLLSTLRQACTSTIRNYPVSFLSTFSLVSFFCFCFGFGLSFQLLLLLYPLPAPGDVTGEGTKQLATERWHWWGYRQGWTAGVALGEVALG